VKALKLSSGIKLEREQRPVCRKIGFVFFRPEALSPAAAVANFDEVVLFVSLLYIFYNVPVRSFFGFHGFSQFTYAKELQHVCMPAQLIEKERST
jgi:hypothetical protein